MIEGKADHRRRGISPIEIVVYTFGVLLLLLVLGIGAVLLYAQSLKSDIKSIADDVVLELWKTGDGTYELNWFGLEAAGADYYYVKVNTYGAGGGNNEIIFFDGYLEGTSCSLADLPTGDGLTFQIDLIKKYSLLGEERIWRQASIQRFFRIQNSAIKNLDCETDPDAGTALVNIAFRGGNCCGVYVEGQDGRKLLKTVDGDSVELNFSTDKDLWIPMPDNPCTLSFVPGKLVNGMAFYGGEARELTVTWEDFAPRDLRLSLEVSDECVCRLEWGGVSYDSCELQMMKGDAGAWETVKTVAGGDERTYSSPRLTPGAEYSFRAVAVTGDSVAVSEVRKCEAAVTPMYCTVWPVKDLTAYSDAAKSKAAGKVKALDAHCVVDVENDMFGVRLEGGVYYIDSNYCMINLPEYVGTLCSYDITNSYDSIFMAHGFEIPGLTGEIIKGFEAVQLADESFLAPLLYPTARKLEKAIENAREKGCRLKIYEAFRPHEASVYMYQKASEIQYAPLPESTYRGEDPGVVIHVAERDENGAVIERRKTYWELMNDEKNSFNLSAFVSGGISRHNLGVALDLTLESLDTGEELTMQTQLHDLSQYSARARNNPLAQELSEIMMSAGYKDLYSEWWHFQDDEIRNKLSLPCVDEGVSPECWMTNGFGWRYRGTDGTYAADCTLTINDKEYTFDFEGYVQE